MTRDEANVVLDLVDAATEGNMPTVREQMAERGYSPAEIVKVFSGIAAKAGRSPMFEESDFNE